MFNFGILRECMLTSYVLFGCSSWGSSFSIRHFFGKWVEKPLLMFATCWMFLIPFGNVLPLHCDFIDFWNVTFSVVFGILVLLEEWQFVAWMSVIYLLPVYNLNLRNLASDIHMCESPCLWQDFQVMALFSSMFSLSFSFGQQSSKTHPYQESVAFPVYNDSTFDFY